MTGIWNPLKDYNILVIKIPEEKKGENKKEVICEVIIIKNFLIPIRCKATSLNS